MAGLDHLGMGGLVAGYVADGYVGYVGVIGVGIDVVLVVVFGAPEGGVGLYLGSYGRMVLTTLIERGYLLFGHCLFAGVAVEDDGAVLGAFIRALAIHLRGVFLCLEVYFEQLGIGDLCAVVIDVHGFGMAGIAGFHILVGGVRSSAACIARYAVYHALNALKKCLLVPEAACGEGSLAVVREIGGYFVGGKGIGYLLCPVGRNGLSAGAEAAAYKQC